SYRMLGLRAESKYADIIERVLLNSGLSGISIRGTEYFYTNPLRMVAGARSYNDHENATETPNREPYLECFCCPPNLVRTIAKSSGWAYSLTDNGVSVNLYGGNRLDTKLADGSQLRLKQETNYPWEGDITLTIEKCKETPFDILLRIPEWGAGAQVQINGERASIDVTPGTFARLEQRWLAGDVIRLHRPMEPRLVEGHPRIEEIRNQVAVCRGPIVYCIESPDLPEDTSILDVHLAQNAPLKPVHRPDLLGGVTVIETQLHLRKTGGDSMYRKVAEGTKWKVIYANLVPYYAWSNRGTAEMTVFLPVLWTNA
ncbi:MAG: beta-L-arabinofuranosidase domain-containing protein, partial [Bacteroidota bacterium]